MKSLLLVISFGFTAAVFAQQGDFENLLEKERSITDTNHPDSLLKAYYFLFNGFYSIDEKKSTAYLTNYFRLAKSEKDSLAIGMYYFHTSLRKFYDHSYEDVLVVADSAAFYLKGQSGFQFLEASILKIRALIFLGRETEAEILGRKLIQDKSFEKYSDQMGKVFYYLGLLATYTSADSSIFYLKKAEFYFLQYGKNNLMANIYHSLSEMQYKKSNLDSALWYAAKAVDLVRDSVKYHTLDFLIPAYNLKMLLEQSEKFDESLALFKEIQEKRYHAKVKEIAYPDVKRGLAFQEFVRNREEFRSLILRGIVISLTIIFGIVIFFFLRLKKRKRELTETLNLNEVLYKEINHRVKNNYQLMISMLNLRSNYSVQSVAEFVDQTRTIIFSMSKAHDLFLENGAASATDTTVFFKEIILSLQESLEMKSKNITVSLESTDCNMETNKLLILGLILNELIINSVKHAFHEKGQIEITLKEEKGDLFFRYRDNGSGFDTGSTQGKGLGMTIVYSLIKQLRGEFRMIHEGGTNLEFRFRR